MPEQISLCQAALPVLLAAALGLCLGMPSGARAACPDGVTPDPLKILSWSPAEQLCGYRRMNELWPAARAGKAGVSSPLPAGRSLAAEAAARKKVREFMRGNGVWGLLVLRGGTVVLEEYREPFGPGQLWTSFSMAKTITSLLVGAALQDGAIKSLDDPVTRYLPELERLAEKSPPAGGAYAGVTVRELLSMTSGAAWNEDYTAPCSDVARLADLANTTEPVFLRYMANLPRRAAPGTLFNYSTGEAGLIGHLLRRATGKGLAEYLEEKIWRPMGMEDDAWWNTDKAGAEVSGCCFNASLRDYGRLGLFMLAEFRAGAGKTTTHEKKTAHARYDTPHDAPEGQNAGAGTGAGGSSAVLQREADGGRSASIAERVALEPVLAKGYLRKAAEATMASLASGRMYGYQIWVREGGAFQASGIFGQLVHVDPGRDMVTVMLSAWDRPIADEKTYGKRAEFVGWLKKEAGR